MGVGHGAGRGPGVFLGTEVCATMVLLCWLCCWPDDSNSDSSSSAENPGRYPSKPVLIEPGSRRRSGELFGRRVASSAVSLHLPSTSGYAKQPLSAHRSHEEIRSRRKSHHEVTDNAETRYHSAPSVIDEVIHRRDWERSTKDLYIPLNPENEVTKTESTPSVDAPYAEPESSSVECLRSDDRAVKLCKKHYTNIKSSKGKKCKESNKDDIKDTDATEVEVSNFYIGETHEASSLLTRASTSNDDDLYNRPSESNYEDFAAHERLSEERTRSIYQAKEAKQSLNESIRLKELPRKEVPREEQPRKDPLRKEQPRKEPSRKGLGAVTEGEVRYFALDDDLDVIDRSGAVHHTIESRLSLRQYPPPSVETVGYEGGACYLAEVGSVSELRARMAGTMSPHALSALDAVSPDPLGPLGVLGPLGSLGPLSLGPLGQLGSMRARHASDGDILAPPHRPESGAFSESDLDLDLDSEERPPDYDEAQLYASSGKKETAI